ncbi:hypothetical protein [Metabacillus malikii]|uniref:YhfM-like domain-containing protein n=1 Tax=Metabacillus malikii TaxID=1504265 RepID=A0ABT9ZK07_9BACI|nr:hypothetical protein [Metabacillus malikii]MDQ0232629.1 hypothetical protein [Metabacillus malikii]
MKKTILLFTILAVLFMTSGCLSELNGQKITVQKRTGEENIFEDFNEITQKNQVKKAIDIVNNANWEHVKVEMAEYADYQFQFPPKNRKSNEHKIASYLLWISPNSENVELHTDSDRHVKLNRQDSADLYEILTGEALIN